MGTIIGCVGVVASIVYFMYFGFEKELKTTEKKEEIVDEEQQSLIGNNIDVENGNINVDSGAEDIKKSIKKDQKSISTYTKVVAAKVPSAPIQKTMWVGVIGVYLIMILNQKY